MHEVRPEAGELEPVETPLPLSHLVHTLTRYRSVIGLGMLAVVAGYTVVAVFFFLTLPARRTTSLPFRLTFEGVPQGTYPNGRKFSTADITASQILLKVFNDNHLSEFTDYPTFSRSIFVLEANQDYEKLIADYRAQLMDPRLTVVDRERLFSEFEMKRASLSKSDYSINFVSPDNIRRIPAAVVEKALRDTLATWADDAATRKQVLQYSVSVLSTNILDANALDTHGPILALLLLRNRVNDLNGNILAIAKIPGAPMVRTSKRRASLDEIKLQLDDIVRFKIDPLIEVANTSDLVVDRAATLRVLEAQIFYYQNGLRSARARETAMKDALAAYESKRTTLGPESGAPGGAESKETVMPQISDTFLDRLVAVVSDNADREYRQKLVDQIRNASLEAIPVDAGLAYSQRWYDVIRSGGGGKPIDRAVFRARWNDAVASVTAAVGEINEIYLIASRQLNPSTELFTISSPAMHYMARPVSWNRLALVGLAVSLLALVVLVAFALLHNRIREETVLETHPPMREATS